MEKLPVASLVVCTLIAGACAAVGSPVGTWEIDKAAMKAAAASLPEAEIDRMLGGIEQSTIELDSDGTATLRARVLFDGRTIEEATTGTWRLEGGVLYVVVKSRHGSDVIELFDYDVTSLTGRLRSRKLTMIYRRR